MNPMTLQSLASKPSGIRLVAEWANANMSMKNVLYDDYCHSYTCPDHDRFIRRMYEMQMPPSIAIPQRIQHLIEANITPVLIQVESWILYHHSKLFFHDNPASSLNEYLVKFIWKLDRSIDYEATAKNILTSAKLNDMEKFRFACTYCLIDEIENFRELADIAADLDFETEPFLVYWSKYLKNELHTIYLSKKIPIEMVMFRIALKEYGLWPAIAYFFTKLDTINKFREFESFTRYCGEEYRLELLEKLNDRNWTAACRHSIGKIVKIFAECGDFQEIRCIWKRFEDQLDSHSFSRIFAELVPVSMRNSRNFNAMTPLLIDIWTGARDELKNSTIRARLLHRIGVRCAKVICDDENFNLGSCRELDDPMRFLRMLFDGCEPEQQEKFICDNFLWLILWQPLDSVVELLEEIVVDDQCVQKLKFETKYSPKLQLVCAKMLRFGRFDEFNDIVWFCWFDERFVISLQSVDYYRKVVAMSVPGVKALCGYLYFHDWRRVFEFVVDIFSNDDSISPYNFMSSLIELGAWGTRFAHIFHEKCFVVKKICRGELRDIMDIVNLLGQPVEFAFRAMQLICTQTLFACLFNECEEFIFRRSEIRDFLIWSYGSEDVADERFRISATSIYPKAFLGQLRSCVDGFTFRATDSMEEFLQWCFKKKPEIGIFKREMIYQYREYKLIGDLLAQKRYRSDMLRWFFEDDVYLIEKFINEELKKTPKEFNN